jgi:hypothetical protein
MFAAATTPPKAPSPAKRLEPAAGQQKPKLLTRLRDALRSRHSIPQTDRTYCHTGNATMIYTHVPNRGGRGERSPADTL